MCVERVGNANATQPLHPIATNDAHHTQNDLLIEEVSFVLSYDAKTRGHTLLNMMVDSLTVFCSLTLWQPRQLPQRLKHHWDLMVSACNNTQLICHINYSS